MPDFIWPAPIKPIISEQLPATPKLTHPRIRRLWGYLHYYLRSFSETYCGWVGIPYDNQIAQLPFGLILKWSDGTRLEEVATMQVARKAGLPVPKVICYGEHPDSPHAPISILMTRLPGSELGRAYKTLSESDRNSIFEELEGYLEAIRKWKNPWGVSAFLITTLVQDGHITGFLDWESSGWYPEYWEFTTALKATRKAFWWYDFVIRLGGDAYETELDCERALTSLTSGSYYW
ncbi:uncharacterized protein TRUGW13939_07103 [Talaromyces rugulosus]|uniref:Aminoglycoside phosphotransferase domain-containing protein n=1 Tax=Talaromyces rugulosus TaxID=121627 RepID=A0A7H8R2V1_TALRU|nr:uncharacterized protein TRUGW13939_07103 [Talaromyces rugulosus]QKX59961.1 hypothetical protein TRUGW13939_07103 [Talaromyces rugulosus]